MLVSSRIIFWLRMAGTLFPALILLIVIALSSVSHALPLEQLTINYIEAATAPDKSANEVRAYVTVTDIEGKPVQDLKRESFKVLEDGRSIALREVSRTTDPMSLVLVIDTSGSMQARDKSGMTSMEAAKRAAVNFISRLDPDDRIALYSFNNETVLELDFTTDHKVAMEALDRLQSKHNAATRLYDAAMEAVKKSAEIPRGRRAIILLTDGKDEKAGQKFSLHSSSDVIDAATTKSIRVPIYTIGVGPQVDERELGRLAGLTGGRRLLARSLDQLQDFYEIIAHQLKNQYVLVYMTRGPSGEHSLVIKVRYERSGGQDERRFWTPPLPVMRAPRVSFISPAPNASITGKTEIALQIEPEETVARIRYFENGTLQEELTSAPFKNFDWDTTGLPAGLHILRAEVIDRNGQIGSAEITVRITSGLKSGSFPATEVKVEVPARGVYVIGVALLGFILLALGLAAFLRRKKPVEKSAYFISRPQRETPSHDTLAAPVDNDRTMFCNDSQETLEETIFAPDDHRPPLAILTVVKSLNLDPGKVFEVCDKITIGRNSTNDIFIPDKPVSRKHAEIYLEAGEFYIRDLGSRNGTLVNDRETTGDGLKIEDESLIKLSSRTILEFRIIARGEEEEMIGEDDETKVTEGFMDDRDNDTKLYEQ